MTLIWYMFSFEHQYSSYTLKLWYLRLFWTPDQFKSTQRKNCLLSQIYMKQFGEMFCFYNCRFTAINLNLLFQSSPRLIGTMTIKRISQRNDSEYGLTLTKWFATTVILLYINLILTLAEKKQSKTARYKI